jgi:ornithine--oxo-acid transaminase
VPLVGIGAIGKTRLVPVRCNGSDEKVGPAVSDFIAREARFGAQNYEPLGVILSRGEGVFVWDTQGNRYLDCLSAYSAVNQGHCHPKILAAMVEQAGKLTLTSRAFHNDQLAPFYEQIAELTRLPQGAADEQRC